MAQRQPAKRARQPQVLVPRELYEQLKTSAKREHRSIIGQMAYILERYYASQDSASGHTSSSVA